MLLRDRNVERFMTEITAEEKEKLLGDMCIQTVKHEKASTKCSICSKRAGLEGKAWMLTDGSGSPVLDDRFESDACADLTKKCLVGLLVGDLKDSLPPKMDEQFRSYIKRFEKHLESVEILATID